MNLAQLLFVTLTWLPSGVIGGLQPIAVIRTCQRGGVR
jgi:hypothetical protein